MKKGFTLIELLVVVLIIGILAAIALPQYMKAVEKSRASEAVSLVKSILDAEQIYFMANGRFTDDLSALDISFQNVSGSSTFHTNNFKITIQAYNPYMYGVQARRAKSGQVITSGDNAYMILAIFNDANFKGTWDVYLYGSDSDLCETSMCKSIRQIIPGRGGDAQGN